MRLFTQVRYDRNRFIVLDRPYTPRKARPMEIKDALTRIDRIDVPSDQRQAEHFLERAIETKADVSVIERLMVIRRELKAEAAEEAYKQALAAFQAECPQVIRTVAGHENRYRYAPLEVIVKTVKPYLERHGFSFTVNTVASETSMEALVTVQHRAGHQMTTSFKVPTESRAGMSPAQKYGAAATFAKRYAFCNAFGILTAERDTDAAPEAGSSVTELNKKLWELLAPVRGEANNWRIARQWLVDECNFDPSAKVADMDAGQLQTLIQRVGERLKELGKSK